MPSHTCNINDTQMMIFWGANCKSFVRNYEKDP